MRRIAATLTALLLLALLSALLTGCLPKNKAWVHPRIADPRKEDMQFLEDTEFCKAKAGPQATEQAMADCYRRLGWQPRERD